MEKSKILIVDDNPKNIQVLANSLSCDIYEIEYTTKGPDAIDWIKKDNFTLILLDVMMPEMDGFTVCKKIKEMPDKNEIPIIFITARNDIESISRAFEIGGIDYITKPFNKKELCARVKTHVVLRKAQLKLNEVNKWLEEEVAERTLQLKKANQELELLDDAKTEFLNLLSHEIRTPLNGIKGFLGLLKEKIQSEKLLVYLRYLQESSDRLEKFSQMALIITSLKSKHRKLIPSKISLNDLIDGIINELLKVNSDKLVNISRDYKNKDLSIEGDSELLQLSISQIIENSIIHATEKIEISININETYDDIELLIKDNGNGFSDQALSSLFEPFSMGQQHHDKKVGLGLYMVKLIADSHNANIEVGNNKDKGAYVKLTLNKEFKYIPLN
ncbi:MAG: hybrid sensor histidine kinase/response regulator [Bacteroidales bacterium]|jgi:two-component system sensor histidine kinase/response regulator|nr:hybrid sensor histidine kinase/response regulator [Bacteroidales bacterium]